MITGDRAVQGIAQSEIPLIVRRGLSGATLRFVSDQAHSLFQ